MMKDERNAVFRSDAMRRFGEARARAVLPRFISPRVVAWLWVLIALFGAGGALVWLARVPVYASGSAVVVSREVSAKYGREGLMVVAFLPPEQLPRLRAGQQMSLLLQNGERFSPRILEVEPEVSSPSEARERFVLNQSLTASIVAQPVAVALAQFEPLNSGLPPDAYAGSIARADVQTGNRRIISLLPVIGKLFAD